MQMEPVISYGRASVDYRQSDQRSVHYRQCDPKYPHHAETLESKVCEVSQSLVV